jgi:hypothetical protein
MNDSLSLREASVQDIQLELLRRTDYNALDGEKVYASLMKYRSLWLAVLLDRLGRPNFEKPRHLLSGGLIKLRDLPDNIWNADTLFILTRTKLQARELAQIVEEEDWGGDSRLHEDQSEIDNTLGTGREEFGLLSIWWD